jgi:hypothetical protein
MLSAQLENADLSWYYRVAIVVFIVSFISAPEEATERLALRAEFEARGLQVAFDSLKKWSPPKRLLEHMDLYTSDKDGDRLALEEELRSIGDGVK